MATIDLTLNAIKIPALDGYTPPFGTKKVSGGLTTQEVNDNVIAPFVKERPIEITETSSTGNIEYNASLVINSADAVLTLGSGTYVGCTVKVIAATAGSVSYNSGSTDTLIAGQIVNYIWTGSGWSRIVPGHRYAGGGYIYYQENTITGNQTVDGAVTADGLLIVDFGKSDSTGYSLNIAINGVVAAFIYQGQTYPNGTVTLPVKSGDTYSIYTNNDTTGHWFIHAGLCAYRA